VFTAAACCNAAAAVFRSTAVYRTIVDYMGILAYCIASLLGCVAPPGRLSWNKNCLAGWAAGARLLHINSVCCVEQWPPDCLGVCICENKKVIDKALFDP